MPASGALRSVRGWSDPRGEEVVPYGFAHRSASPQYPTADGWESRADVMKSVVIGADPARCDVVLASLYASRVHARIDGKSDGYYCVDAEERTARS